jgi:response regulator of citrate/malate metabolism
MISAADAAIEMPRARQLGLSSYLAKPIDADQFASQLLTIMDGQSLWQTSEAV